MKAFILVDIQNDFLPGGALAVPDGDAVIPVVNRLMPHFDVVVATQDWHPAQHGSFAANHAGNHAGKEVGETIELEGLEQILWPVHCVQGSSGAELAQDLKKEPIQEIFQKGTHPRVDSYSGFFDNGRKDTGLGDWLKQRGVTDVYVAGLATDYCVKATALDAASLGFNTYLVEDACRGVNLQPGDVAEAVETMRHRGVRVIQSGDIVSTS